VNSVALTLAVDMGRVLLPKGGWTWRYKNEFCQSQGKFSLECYYHPWSNCTLEDAAYAAYQDRSFVLTVPAEDSWSPVDDQQLTQLVIKYGNSGFWEEIAKVFGNRTPIQCAHRWNALKASLLEQHTTVGKADSPLYQAVHSEDKGIADFEEFNYQYPFQRIVEGTWQDGHPQFTIPPLRNGKQQGGFPNETFVLSVDYQLNSRYFVPKQFVPLLTCAGMRVGNQYLWWRAIAVAYFIRPNQATLKLLEQQQDQYLKNINGQCVSTYIRHGEKGIEMKLVGTSVYARVADQIWKQKQLPSGMLSEQQKVFYVASEDIDAMEHIKHWGKANNVDVRSSNLSETILSDKVKVLDQFDMEKGFPTSREMEYFSYILHLADTMQCEAFICTDASNYCRVIDELRTTVGGKANRLAVDLSAETCATGPPCYRNHGLGNSVGEVYDPKGKLW
jgi:hypothetical protein